MKIGIVGAWNTSSGAAIHAELVGRALVELGHTVTVFSFYPYSFHGAALTAQDEDYVIRCFTTSRHPEVKLDPRPFLTADYRYLIVEDHGMIPNDPLGRIFHRIRKKAKTVAVIHDGKLSEDPAFYQFPWDALVAFDRRYEAFLRTGYPRDRIVRIPFPSAPLKRGDRRKARKKLNLPGDRQIGFMFGPASTYGSVILPALARAVDPGKFMLLVLTQDKPGLEIFKKARQEKKLDIQIRELVPDMKDLYDYLHAADIAFFHKESKAHVVLSSTIHQTMGAGCPILAFDSNFANYFGPEVTLYRNFDEFIPKCRQLLARGPLYKKMQQSLEAFLKKNDGRAVAKKFVRLLRSL